MKTIKICKVSRLTAYLLNNPVTISKQLMCKAFCSQVSQLELLGLQQLSSLPGLQQLIGSGQLQQLLAASGSNNVQQLLGSAAGPLASNPIIQERKSSLKPFAKVFV